MSARATGPDALQSLLVNGDGDYVCTVSSLSRATAVSPAPRRTGSSPGPGADPRTAVAASYQLDVRDITAGQGCASVADATWGAALPVSATRGAAAAECFTVGTGDGGLHLLRLRAANNGWNMQVQVHDQDGLSVGYVGSGYATFPDLPAGETLPGPGQRRHLRPARRVPARLVRRGVVRMRVGRRHRMGRCAASPARSPRAASSSAASSPNPSDSRIRVETRTSSVPDERDDRRLRRGRHARCASFADYSAQPTAGWPGPRRSGW